eukprot:4736845-Pleurochrysis_carterae.AAC.1
MPNTCVPPIHTTALGNAPDWWAAFKRTIMEIRADVGKHGGHAGRSDQAYEARLRSASAAARSRADFRDAYSAAELQLKNAFLRLRLWCSEEKQIKEFDDLCRYMAERHLS